MKGNEFVDNQPADITEEKEEEYPPSHFADLVEPSKQMHFLINAFWHGFVGIWLPHRNRPRADPLCHEFNQSK